MKEKNQWGWFLFHETADPQNGELGSLPGEEGSIPTAVDMS